MVVHSAPHLLFPGHTAIWEMLVRPRPWKAAPGLIPSWAYQKLSAPRNCCCLRSSCFPYEQPWKLFSLPEWHNIPVLTLSKKVLTQTMAGMKHCYDWSWLSCDYPFDTHTLTHSHTSPIDSAQLISVSIAWILFGFVAACFSLVCLNCPAGSRVNLANKLCHAVAKH